MLLNMWPELIATIVGVILGSGFQYWLWRKEKNSLIDKIDTASFSVYSDQTSPDKIWKGFRDDFKSFNDAWQMEMSSPESYLKAHRERYLDSKCAKFRFLFFIKNDIGQFERFVKFQAMVHLNMDVNKVLSTGFNKLLQKRIESSALPDTLNHIEVYLNKTHIPNQTFFRGYLDQGEPEYKKISIWYLSLDPSRNEPHLILKSHDDRFWRDLDDKWNNMRKGSEKITGKNIFEKYLAYHAVKQLTNA